ncbi:Solute carrier family 25 member 44 [Strongyloides ratti]|uniref:Solute carrier family 25 member 44 n=1 Tax=Strongyloides ratti TaxID=34506 RepID=A0A090LDQ3_STRRB|nr:Solute carrier family 25 member 44 [Strongyloides ratti]CEF65635.2 Solute carrier family 25 member 44 [Strongyloides ratti]
MTSSDTDAVSLDAIEKLHVIEWEHLDLKKFYPMALVTSWTVRTALYPMSVVKSRLQLQRQNEIYKGTFDAFRKIARNEGFLAFYRGFWITLPQLSVSFMYSNVYERIRGVLSKEFGPHRSATISAVSGGVASLFGQLLFVPTDLIAQHMMVYKNAEMFTGGAKNLDVIKALRNDKLEGKLTLGLRMVLAVYKVDGLRGFYRGYISSVMLYAPSSIVFWSSYYHYLDLFKRINLYLVYLVVIRIQVHRTTYLETLQRIIKYEGLSVFSKGLIPRMINNGIYSLFIMLGYERVKQWLQFSRQWHIVDANQQDPYKLGQKVADHLIGKWKPFYHPETDCGDHVVVINCKDIAMKGFDWKHTTYHFDNQYPKGRNDFTAFEIHEYDPCRIMFLATYKKLGNNLVRRMVIERLHLFPSTEIPEFLQKNISNQLRQVQEVPKRSIDYTNEERESFPRLFKRPEDYLLDWEEPIETVVNDSTSV